MKIQTRRRFGVFILFSVLLISALSWLNTQSSVRATTLALAPTPTNTVILNLLPTPTPTPLGRTNRSRAIRTPAPTATPLPLYRPAQPAIELTGLRHEWQTWNNCGPATLSFYLSYYGSNFTQAQTGAVLRHHADDKNVMPNELADFARQQGFAAHVRVNGSSDQLKLLLSNGIPVLIETWLEEEPNDGMGHYRLITGYDEAAQAWIAYDSYVHHNLLSTTNNYRGIWLPFAETDTLWKVFNRTYVLIYSPAQQPMIQNILGAAWEESAMWQQAQAIAQLDTAQHPNDAFAWFNLGSALVAQGDFTAAAAAFDGARAVGWPWRMLWYQFGPLIAYYQTGRYQDVITLADATLVNTNTVEELYYWKGRALAALGDSVAAERQWQRVRELNPLFDLQN